MVVTNSRARYSCGAGSATQPPESTDRSDQCPQGDELTNAGSRSFQAANLEVHTAFEENDRYRVPDQNLQRRTETLGPDDPGDVRSEEDAGGEQKDDARDSEMAGQGLGEHPRHQSDGHGECGVREAVGCWMHG